MMQTASIFLSLSIALLAGLLLSRLAKKGTTTRSYRIFDSWYFTTLLPQAGVALGMAIKAIELGPDGAIVRNITLFAVLIYEIVGPFLTKIALTKAGDIKEEGRKSAREELFTTKQA